MESESRLQILKEIQSKLDEAAGKEVSEGSYVELSKLVKTAYDTETVVNEIAIRDHMSREIEYATMEGVALACLQFPKVILGSRHRFSVLQPEFSQILFFLAKDWFATRSWYNKIAKSLLTVLKTNYEPRQKILEPFKALCRSSPGKLQAFYGKHVKEMGLHKRLWSECMLPPIHAQTEPKMRELLNAFPFIVSLWTEEEDFNKNNPFVTWRWVDVCACAGHAACRDDKYWHLFLDEKFKTLIGEAPEGFSAGRAEWARDFAINVRFVPGSREYFMSNVNIREAYSDESDDSGESGESGESDDSGESEESFMSDRSGSVSDSVIEARAAWDSAILRRAAFVESAADAGAMDVSVADGWRPAPEANPPQEPPAVGPITRSRSASQNLQRL